MEIRTTKEIQEWTQQPVESDNVKWVKLDDVICDIDERISAVNNALGNQEDVGYLKALECLLEYYLELFKSIKGISVNTYNRRNTLFVRHIEQHLKDLNIHEGKVLCKICGKDIDEIVGEDNV